MADVRFAYGFPSYRRVDLELWCRRLPNFGWAVCASSGEVSRRPFDDPGDGDLPPEGIWVSRKGDRSYVYELIRAQTQSAGRDIAVPP
jgi:hypothetical protein